MKILIGLILIAIGVLIIQYRYQIHNFTGDWDWTIKYFGGNGTIVAIVLIGMLLIGAGASYPFWAFDNFGKSAIIETTKTPTSSNSAWYR